MTSDRELVRMGGPQVPTPGNVKMGLPYLPVACADLKDGFGDEVEWPELAVVGVPRHLQVDRVPGHFRKVIGLVVHHDNRTGSIAARQQFAHTFPLFLIHPLPGEFLPSGQNNPEGKVTALSRKTVIR